MGRPPLLSPAACSTKEVTTVVECLSIQLFIQVIGYYGRLNAIYDQVEHRKRWTIR